MATHSSILAWEIPRTEELGGATVHGVSHDLVTKQQRMHIRMYIFLLFCIKGSKFHTKS